MPMTAGKVSHQVVTKLMRSRVSCDGLQRDGRVPAWARRTLEEHTGYNTYKYMASCKHTSLVKAQFLFTFYQNKLDCLMKQLLYTVQCKRKD